MIEIPEPPTPAPPPDNVRYVSFGQQSDLPDDAAPGRCRHHSYKVNAERRQIRCGACGVELDAFAVILEYARAERSWRHWDGEARKKRAELAMLAEDERRTKARLKHAKRKDAREAVAEEQRRTERERGQTIDVARELADLARRLERIGRRIP